MIRKISITLAILLGLAIALPVLALGLLHTAAGARFVERQASAQTEGAIELEGLELHSFLDVRVARLAMDGVEVKGLDLDWSPLSLLGRTAQINSLLIAEVTISQTEVAPAVDAKVVEEPFALPQVPELPVAIDAKKIEVETLVFAAPAFGLEGRYTLAGAVRATRNLGEVAANLNANRLSGAGAFTLKAQYGAGQDDINIQIDFRDEDGAPLAALTGFDGGALSMQLKAQGPLTGTALTLDLAMAQGPQAQAQLVLGYDEAVKLSGVIEVALRGLGGPDVAAYLGDKLVADIEASLTPNGALSAFVRTNLAAPKITTNLVARAQGRVGGDLTLNIDSTQTRLADLPPALGPVDVQLRSVLDQSTNVLNVSALRAKAQALDVSFTGQVPLGDPYRAELEGTVAVRDLAALAPDLKGDAKADMQVRGTGADTPLALILNAQANAASGDMALMPIQLQAQGTAALDGALDVKATLSLPTLAPLDPRLKGALTLVANLKGAMGSLAADATIRTKGLSFEGAPLTALEADIALAQKGEGAAGNADVRVLTTGAPLKLSAPFAYDGAMASLTNFTLAGPGLKGAGSVSYDVAAATGKGGIDIALDDLGQLAALAGMAANGQGQIALKLNGEAVALNASLNALGGADLGAVVESANVDLTTRLGDPMGALRGQVRAQNVVAGGASVSALDLDLAAGKAGPSFALTLSANAPVDLETQANGAISFGDATTLTLNALQGVVDGEAFALAAPTRFRVGVDGMSLADTVLTVGAGKIAAAFAQTETQVQGRVALTALNLSNQMPNGFPLTLNGGASIQGVTHNPTVQLDLRATAPLEALDEELQITAKGALSDGALNANLVLAGAGGDFESRVTGRATANLRDGIFALAENVPLAVKANGAVRLAPFAFLLFDDGSTLRGAVRLEADAVLAGGPERMAGSLCLQNFAAGLVASGTALKGGAGCVTLTADGAVNGQISMTDGHSGTLDVALKAGPGTLLLSGLSADVPPQLAARVQLAKLRVVDGDMGLVKVSGVVDGKAALEAALTGALAGSLTVEQADLVIPANPGPSFTPLEVRHVGRPQDTNETASAAPASTLGTGLDLDMKIDVPGQFFVRGRGIESEWQGDVAVGGTLAMPIIGGKISMIKGQATTGAAVLSFNRGVVTLVPDPPALAPIVLIDMVSEANVDGTTARMTLAGPVTEPKISFSSEPTLPEDEILARLLFGKPAAQMTASEALSMAGAALELSGTFGGGPGVLGRVRRGLGVDRLSVDASADAPTSSSVSAGKYLTPELYMSVKQAADGTAPDIAVEYELTDDITVTGEQEGTGGESVGVRYEYDY